MSVSEAEVERLLGVNISEENIQSILKRLGFGFEIASSSVIPSEAGSHEYFSAEKSLDPDSTRQSPSLQSGPFPTSRE